MSLSTQPYKGARDFYPEDKRLQKYMFARMREAAERFGYEEYDAPILEPIDLYLAKSNQDMVTQETYTFEDRGGRQVVIRPEMTPTVSRMVAGKRQELAYPVRWYSIPNLWRYERPQHGRLREHWQLNVDIFGVSNVTADHEIILVADQILKSYGATADMYTIQINSRRLTNELFGDYMGLGDEQAAALIRLIDKKKKMSDEAFRAAASELTPDVDKLMNLLNARSLDELPDGFSEHESVKTLRELIKLLDESGVTNHVFDVTLMRGFDYYTDVVFEVVDTDPENNRSMFGGGRYDGLVGLFGVEPVPTVGFGMGDVTLQNFLESHNLLPDLRHETDIYAVLIGDVYEQAQTILSELRSRGLNIAVDSTGRGPDKQIKTAVKKGVKYALFIGADELASGQFKLRDLGSSSEQTLTLDQIAEVVK